MSEDERVNAIVEDLLRGRRLRIDAADASEREAIMAAAALAASREGHPRMSPALRRRLAALVAGEREAPLLNRRAALAAVAGLAAGAVGGLGLGRLGGSPPPPRGVPAGILKPAAKLSWITVGAVADFPDGRATEVVAADIRAYVVRRGPTVTAVSSVCSDLPCSLDWREPGSLFCPCHRQTFSAEGTPAPSTRGYPVPPLATFEVKIEAGKVLLRTP